MTLSHVQLDHDNNILDESVSRLCNTASIHVILLVSVNTVSQSCRMHVCWHGPT